MSKSSSALVMITASQAQEYGYRSLFNSGEVRSIVPHRGQEITVRAVRDINSKQVVVKDGNGKQRKAQFSTIKAYGVTPALAERIPA